MHTEKAGALYVPPAAEAMTYDAYGILSSDGRWLYTWDAENRLSSMETRESARLAGVPHVRLLFTYDAMGRRITKKVFRADAQSGQVLVQRESWVFLYEGWNLIAEMDVNAAVPRLARSYEWGPAIDGVGGTGGLLLIRDHLVPAANGPPASQSYAPTYDGNGNITELVNLTTGQVDARYEYGPFGEALRVEGRAIAEKNPFRWATKYLDTESGLSYYGHRYYSADLGRWLSRDPIAESGGVNLYAMVGNDAVNQIDVLGLAACCPFGADKKGNCCNHCGLHKNGRCKVACTRKRKRGPPGSLPVVSGGGGNSGLCHRNGVGGGFGMADGYGMFACIGGRPPSNPTSDSLTLGCSRGGGDSSDGSNPWLDDFKSYWAGFGEALTPTSLWNGAKATAGSLIDLPGNLIELAAASVDIATSGYAIDSFRSNASESWNSWDGQINARAAGSTMGGVWAGAAVGAGLSKGFAANNALPQVLQNQAQGALGEAAVRARLLNSNRLDLVGEQIRITTPGVGSCRVTDFMVQSRQTGRLSIIEVKTGGATRDAIQLAKDALIADPLAPTTFTGRRAAAAGFPGGTPTGPIRTFEVNASNLNR